jgi:regulator of sigma D
MHLGDNERERLKQIRAMLTQSTNSMLDDYDIVAAADTLDLACEEIDQLLEPLTAPEDKHAPVEAKFRL